MYARCRVYNARDNLPRSRLHRLRASAGAKREGFDSFCGAAEHRSNTGLELSSGSGCVHRRDQFIIAVSMPGREASPVSWLSVIR
jgi:hypothetical protein